MAEDVAVVDEVDAAAEVAEAVPVEVCRYT